MAGEIHNFNKKRKRPNWQDDRSTGKYYDSGDISAIQGQTSAADSTLKPGQQPKGKKYAPPKTDDRRADKYYANQTQLAPTKQQLARGSKLGRPAQLGERRPQLSPQEQQAVARRAADPNANMTVTDKSEVNGVTQEVVNRLQEGQTGVVVYIQKGNSDLLRRTRAALEMLVTKEVITEEQYHEVRLSYTLGAGEQEAVAQKLGVPAPKGEKEYEDNTTKADPEDFLSGGMTADDEEEARIVMANTTEIQLIDTTDDVQDSPAPAYPSAPAAEDDDDSDFMAKTPPADKNAEQGAAYTIPGVTQVPDHHIGIEQPAMTAPAEVAISESQETPDNVGLTGGIETPTEAMDGVGDAPSGKKPGRRSGRGSK